MNVYNNFVIMSRTNTYKILFALVLLIMICLFAFNDTIREEIKSIIVRTPQTAECRFGGSDGNDGSDNTITGTIKFTEDVIGGACVLEVRLTNVPTGIHALHIHEYGNIDYPGPHYNPHGAQHSDLNNGHVGDLGNIVADETQTVEQKIVSKDVKLSGPYSVLGRLVVIRTTADDLESGLTGDVAAHAVIAHSM